MAKQVAVMARGGYVRSWQLAHTAAGARSLTKRLEGQGQAKRKTQHNLAREVSANGGEGDGEARLGGDEGLPREDAQGLYLSRPGQDPKG